MDGFEKKLCSIPEQSDILFPNMIRAIYDTSVLRQRNLSRVLSIVWENDGLSRADIARRLDLSRSSISSMVEQLLSFQVIRESHLAASSGGRPPVVLQFEPSCSQIIGVDMGSSHLMVLLMNLRGEIKESKYRDHNNCIDPAKTIELIIEMINDLDLEQPLLGIGVAAPSPVLDGMLCERILPEWQGIDLIGSLQEYYQVPVYIDNDANLGALAEKWWGSCVNVDDFVFVKMATGVGSGIVQKGQVVNGDEGYAGELGHVPISQTGQCRCGMIGCLEAHIGLPHVALLLPETTTEPSTLLQRLANSSEGSEIVSMVAGKLSIALSMVINILNPQKIVLWGPIPQQVPKFINVLREIMNTRNLWSPLDTSSIIISDLGHQCIARGAATLILEEAFANPVLFQKNTI